MSHECEECGYQTDSFKEMSEHYNVTDHFTTAGLDQDDASESDNREEDKPDQTTGKKISPLENFIE